MFIKQTIRQCSLRGSIERVYWEGLLSLFTCLEWLIGGYLFLGQTHRCIFLRCMQVNKRMRERLLQKVSAQSIEPSPSHNGRCVYLLKVTAQSDCLEQLLKSTSERESLLRTRHTAFRAMRSIALQWTVMNAILDERVLSDANGRTLRSTMFFPTIAVRTEANESKRKQLLSVMYSLHDSLLLFRTPMNLTGVDLHTAPRKRERET